MYKKNLFDLSQIREDINALMKVRPKKIKESMVSEDLYSFSMSPARTFSLSYPVPPHLGDIPNMRQSLDLCWASGSSDCWWFTASHKPISFGQTLPRYLTFCSLFLFNIWTSLFVLSYLLFCFAFIIVVIMTNVVSMIKYKVI